MGAAKASPTMRLSLPTLLLLGSATLTACIGNIGGGDEDADVDGPVPGSSPTAFGCDPTAAELTASPLERLARDYVRHALEELFSPLDDTARAALLASLQTRLELIPIDADPHAAEVTQDHVDGVFGLAIATASQVANDPATVAALLGICSGTTSEALDDPSCLDAFLRHYGRKAFRRPLTEDELADFAAFYQQALDQGADGLAALLGRFVAHPNFYYRLEHEGELVAGTEGGDATYRLTRWELLSKVTFLFWASPPTDALYDLAETTDITEDAGLEQLLEIVLADPRAERGVLGFVGEWLHLDGTLRPGSDGNLPAVQTMVEQAGVAALPTTHREDMVQEVLDLAKHYTLSTKGRLEDLLTSRYSFAKTEALASIYGVDPWDGSAEHLVSLPEGERAGLLTRAAMLASNAEYTRPIIKGKVIRTQLLCQDIPPPPADLKIDPLVHPDDQTTRTSVEDATSAAACQACHGSLNELGFATEGYDPLGRFRTAELRFDEAGEVVSELPVDTTAEVTLYDGESRVVADAVELSDYIAESGVAHKCMVRHYFRFVKGREEDDQADSCELQSMLEALHDDGGSIQSMLKASAQQDSFRLHRTK
ncbi:MAG: DUF1588 domain-containing protein [Polyangiaceae bacterium]